MWVLNQTLSKTWKTVQRAELFATYQRRVLRNRDVVKKQKKNQNKTATEMERAVVVHFKHVLPQGPAALHKRSSNQRCRLIKKKKLF